MNKNNEILEYIVKKIDKNRNIMYHDYLVTDDLDTYVDIEIERELPEGNNVVIFISEVDKHHDNDYNPSRSYAHIWIDHGTVFVHIANEIGLDEIEHDGWFKDEGYSTYESGRQTEYEKKLFSFELSDPNVLNDIFNLLIEYTTNFKRL